MPSFRQFRFLQRRLLLCLCRLAAVYSSSLAGGSGGGASPSFNPSALSLRRSTSTYSFSEAEDSPSLAPGVGGNCPAIGGTSPFPSLQEDFGLPSPVFGRFAVAGRDACFANSVASGLVGFALFDAELWLNVSPSGVRGFGLERPDGDLSDAAAFRRSSVALIRASRASSSDVCEETAFFLCG